MSEILLETCAQASTVVDRTNTADTVGSGLLPVFSTPMMIALMEKAASCAVEPFLEKGQTTVGTIMKVSHDVASPVGAKIIATATVIAVDRRRIDFAVEAREGEKIIGKGTHSRFIVNSEQFLSKIY
jgi:predicted thioesterase